MTKEDLICSIRVSLFADRPTLIEAYEYANEIAMSTDNPSAVMTAVQVLANTIANEIEKMD